MNITYIVHTYRIIKIKSSLHHTIAKLEHYFTIAFRGVFQSIYQNLVETTFDTNNYCKITLVS
jgi:hypothetical protein